MNQFIFLKRIPLYLLLSLFAQQGWAQVTLDFESGNRNVDAANCWSFSGVGYRNNTTMSGNYFGRSGTHSATTVRYVRSSWVELNGSGTIEFSFRHSGGGGGNLNFEVVLSDKNLVESIIYSATATTTINNQSVNIADIGTYRVIFRTTSAGGFSAKRLEIDNISIDGTDVADRNSRGLTPAPLDGSCDCLPAIPVANPDAFTIDEDDPATTFDVAANDTDDDSDLDPTSVSITTSATSGATANVNAAGEIVYTPLANFFGQDTITYAIYDQYAYGPANGDTTILVITVNPINDPPVAVDDGIVNVLEGSATSIDVISNDSDIDNATTDLTIIVGGSSVSGGSLSVVSGAVEYIPIVGFTGNDSFTYAINDGLVNSNMATVTLSVVANQPPTANNDLLSVPEDTTNVSIEVLANDTDPDNTTTELSISSVSVPSQGGSATIAGNQIIYDPKANFFGTETFTYTINDPSGATSNATVTVEVVPVNDAPQAVNDTISIVAGNSTIVDVLINDTDTDDVSLTITSIDSTTTVGVVTISDNKLTYSISAQYQGDDVVKYTIEDASGAQTNASLVILVLPLSSLPTIQVVSLTGTEDSSLTFSSSVFTQKFNDDDGDSLKLVKITSLPENGTLLLGGDPVNIGDEIPVDQLSQLSFVPDENFAGTVTFGWNGSDGSTYATNSSSISITIDPVNDPPIAKDYTLKAEGTAPTASNVLDHVEDIESDSLFVNETPVQQPSHGTVTIFSDGRYEYTASSDFSGQDQFIIEVCESQPNGLCTQVTVMVTVSQPTFIVSEGFSPNGDGINDQWYIRGIEAYPNNSVVVFDRWGSLIYKTQGYNNSERFWDGNSTNGMVPAGTYFYKITITPDAPTISGYLVIQ